MFYLFFGGLLIFCIWAFFSQIDQSIKNRENDKRIKEEHEKEFKKRYPDYKPDPYKDY